MSKQTETLTSDSIFASQKGLLSKGDFTGKLLGQIQTLSAKGVDVVGMSDKLYQHGLALIDTPSGVRLVNVRSGDVYKIEQV